MIQQEPRAFAYGQRRRFTWLERIAIGLRAKAAEQILDQLGERHTSFAVLELGCGFDANLIYHLKCRFPAAEFTGVDLKINPLAPPMGGIELLEADLTKWQPSHQFDCVISLAVIEHLSQPEAHFDLIARSLAENGIALLTTPTPLAHQALWLLCVLGQFDNEEIRDHKLYLTKEGIEYLAKAVGLQVTDYQIISFGMNHRVLLRKCQSLRS